MTRLGITRRGLLLAAAAPEWLDFVHLTDTHLIYPPGIDPRLIEMRKMFATTIQTLPGKLVEFQRDHGAAFALITGDLVDVFSFLAADGGVVEGQVEAFARVAAASPIPVYAALGNHDVQHYGVFLDGARERLLADQSVVEHAKASWIRNVPCFAQGTYYSFARRVGSTTWRFAVLNNGFYGHQPPDAAKRAPQYTFGRGQLDWLKGIAAASQDSPMVLAMHIPPEGAMLAELKQALAGRTGLTVMFTGHHHEKNHVHPVEAAGMRLYHVSTPGYCDSVNHWRRVRLYADRVELAAAGKPDQVEAALQIRA